MRTQSLWLLDYDSKKNSVMSQERIKIGHRIRDLGISPAGKIVIITDDQNIIRLAPSKEPKWQDSKKVKIL